MFHITNWLSLLIAILLGDEMRHVGLVDHEEGDGDCLLPAEVGVDVPGGQHRDYWGEVQQQSWDWWKWRSQSVLKVTETAASLSGDVRNFFYNCEFDAKITELVYLRSTLPSRLTLWESGRDHVEPLWSLLQSTQRLGHQRRRSRIKCSRGPLWCQRSSLVGLSSSSETRKHCHHRKGGTNKDNLLSKGNSLYAWCPVRFETSPFIASITENKENFSKKNGASEKEKVYWLLMKLFPTTYFCIFSSSF